MKSSEQKYFVVVAGLTTRKAKHECLKAERFSLGLLTCNLITGKMLHSYVPSFPGGNCSPHHRGALRRPYRNATVCRTARMYRPHRSRTCGMRSPPLSRLRTAEDCLMLKSRPPRAAQQSGRRWFPSRPLRTPSPPHRPARYATQDQ